MGITHDDVGAWLLKGNPDKGWDYWAKRKAERWPVGVRTRSSWSLGPTYRNGLIRQGDKIILFMTGRTQAVVELGRRNEEPVYEEPWDSRYVIDEAQRGKPKQMVGYSSVLLPTPVSRDAIVAVPALAQAEFLRAPQLTNPTFLTPREVKAFVRLIPPHILKLAGW